MGPSGELQGHFPSLQSALWATTKASAAALVFGVTDPVHAVNKVSVAISAVKNLIFAWAVS
jgi:hypothetical protein